MSCPGILQGSMSSLRKWHFLTMTRTRSRTGEFGVKNIHLRRSGHNFAHATAAELSWHAPNYDLMLKIFSTNSNTYSPGAHFTDDFCLKFKQDGNLQLCLDVIEFLVIRSQQIFAHTAVVACAKFCSDYFVRIEIRAKWNFHWILILIEKPYTVKLLI